MATSSSSVKLQIEWEESSESSQAGVDFRWLGEFAAGAAASAISAATVYPVDVVKTRMQVRRGLPGSAAVSPWAELRELLSSEGPRGLYRGLLAQLAGQVPEKAVRLALVERVRRALHNEDHVSARPEYAVETAAGLVAGLNQVLITNPAEVVKVRLQVGGSAAGGAWQLMAHELGLRGLYRGAMACLLRDMPFSGIYFPLYAHMKYVLRNPDAQESPLSVFRLFVAATVAGAAAASATTPADVIKTRMQAKRKAATEGSLPGLLAVTLDTYRNEGFRAFFKGLQPRVLRTAPQYGVMLLAYEHLLGYLPSSSLSSSSDAATLSLAEDKLGLVLEERWRPPTSFLRGGTDLRQVSIGGANAVWALSHSDSVFRWSGKAWDPVPGHLLQLSAGADGEVWGVAPDRSPMRLNVFSPSSWDRVPGQVSHVTVGNRAMVFALEAETKFPLQWMPVAPGGVSAPGSWARLGEVALRHISAGADGELWAIAADHGSVLRYSRRRHAWIPIPFPSKARWVSVGSRDIVWVTDDSGAVFRLINGSWVLLRNKAPSGRVSVGFDGSAAAAPSEHDSA